jgi:predicted phosphoribosyltransferase
MIFRDRHDAGRKLAEKLSEYAGRDDVLVLALPRGGVPVAYEVAVKLAAPLDVFLIRKLGVPGHEELAMGAIASGGTRVLNKGIVTGLHIPVQVIDAVAEAEKRELARREIAYRDGTAAADLKDKIVILIDDGLATGATMKAAVLAIKEQRPRKVIVAVPVSAPDTCEEMEADADAVICAETPQPFYGVGMWYRDFQQTTDEEVRKLLKANRQTVSDQAGNTQRGGV